MDDLISKQAVIDFYNTQFPTLDKGVHWSRNDIIQNLDNIPSIKILTCEDAISRQAAIDALYGMHMYGKSGVFYDLEHLHGSNCDFSSTIFDAVGELENLPSVSVAEKVGEWRHYEGTLICSRCGAEFYDDIMEYCGDDVPKCCPDCGARMVEPQESEDKG